MTDLGGIDLGGKVALVTGASRGIGAAGARRLAQAGAKVVLAARSVGALETVAREIRAAGGEAVSIETDVTRYAQVAAAVALAVERYGLIDILVNNAGLIEPIAHLADSDPVAWGQVADINYKGVYHGLRAAIPEMLARGGGTVVTISSGAASSPLEGWSHYCSSKAAALMLTRCAHLEYGGQGIRVVALSPGTVDTSMQDAIKASGVNPVSRLDRSAHIAPEWVGEAIAWLCTEAGAPFAGTEFSLKAQDNRRLLGLA